jgi:hypothetical protein
MEVFVFLLQFGMFLIIFEHLLDIEPRFPQLLLSFFTGLVQIASQAEIDFLREVDIFIWGSADQGMVEGFFIDGEIFSCMRIDVMGFHIVSVNDAVSFMVGVIATIVFKALAVEIFTEGGVGEVAGLVSELFVVFQDFGLL